MALLTNAARNVGNFIVGRLTTGWAVAFAFFTLLIGSLITELSPRHLIADLLRDTGLAFLIAVLVAHFYELHARGRIDRQTMEGILDVVVGEHVPADVWEEIKDQVIERKLIRKDVVIRFGLKHDSSLGGNLAVIRLEFEYRLHGLARDPVKINLQHELDYQFENKPKNLPRFERFLVERGDKTIFYKSSAELQEIVRDGTISVDVDVGGRDDKRGVRIVTERLELTNIPGSYNLFMTELTKGLRLRVVEQPEDVEIDVKIRPQDRWEKLSTIGDELTYNELILPGRGIEIKLISPPRRASVGD